jgi:hypothetical protein
MTRDEWPQLWPLEEETRKTETGEVGYLVRLASDVYEFGTERKLALDAR